MTRREVDLPGPPGQAKLYQVLMLLGMAIVLAALGVMVWLATVATGVFENPKAVRDAAAAGSSLLGDQGDLFSFPLWVKPFKLLGVTFMWVAIITVLWGIRRTIREALAPAMRERLPRLLQERRLGASPQQPRGGDSGA